MHLLSASKYIFVNNNCGIQQCSSTCVSCPTHRKRYKRLVDNIYPFNIQNGMVKNSMEKLIYFVLTSPEKLECIGEYIFQRASKDIHKKRHRYVVIAVEAMDQLLVVCHAQNLNLFIESFLKLVQILLNSSEPELQLLATQTFVRFSNIEEDIPSYHRRYDFFISKFSSMCHCSCEDKRIQDKIRVAGIKGIQGVIRKTTSDDLVDNVWDPEHVDKIIDSLLYNMQNLQSMQIQRRQLAYKDLEFPRNKIDFEVKDGVEEYCNPSMLAETCLREILGQASFSQLNAVLLPVLRYLDRHESWDPNPFAIYILRIIMFSVQAHYSYAVIENLLNHLDIKTNSKPKIQISMANILSKIISIAAVGSVGPCVLEIINSLLIHVHQSVMHGILTHEMNLDESEENTCIMMECNDDNEVDERLYQEALVSALEEFVNHLPDHQMIEIMMFIMNKVPLSSSDNTNQHRRDYLDPGNSRFQSILLKLLLKVATKYHTWNFNATFPLSFIKSILCLSLASNPAMRLIVQQILQALIDRRHNLEKLLKPVVNIIELDLDMKKCSHSDVIFAHKHGPAILTSLQRNLELADNTVANVEAVYTTAALLCVELAFDDNICDFFGLLINIQDTALTSSTLTDIQKFHLHAVVVSLFVLVVHVVPFHSAVEYALKVVALREERAPYLLPPLQDNYVGVVIDKDDTGGKGKQLEDSIQIEFLLEETLLTDILLIAGFDPVCLQLQPGSYSGIPRAAWFDSNVTKAISALSEKQSSSSVDADNSSNSTVPGSISSSLGNHLKHPGEGVTFESIKILLSDSHEENKIKEEERCRQLYYTFLNADFDELISITQQNENLQNRAKEIINHPGTALDSDMHLGHHSIYTNNTLHHHHS